WPAIKVIFILTRQFTTRIEVPNSPQPNFRPGVLATESPSRCAALASAGITVSQRTGSRTSRPSYTTTNRLLPILQPKPRLQITSRPNTTHNAPTHAPAE